jgi:uncharacterized membrane protein YphA (DoxX/SURF4 family)
VTIDREQIDPASPPAIRHRLPRSSPATTEGIGRALLGVPFLVAGTYKFVDPAATGANAEAPGAAFFAAARDTFIFAELAALEVIGGLLLILGFAVPLCALGFIPLVGTIVAYSANYVPPGPEVVPVISIVTGSAILLWIHRSRYLSLILVAPPLSWAVRKSWEPRRLDRSAR